MTSALARPALLAALTLAAAACSADQALAPAPPSLATGTTPVYQEPIPPDSPGQCMSFDSLPVGTRWGASVGTPKGSIVHKENNIDMWVTDFLPASGTAWYQDAVIRSAPYPDVLINRALLLDKIGVVFDFSAFQFAIDRVTFRFVDRSTVENLAVDGSPVYIGQVAAWPTPIVRSMILHDVVLDLRAGIPTRGEVTIYGDLNSVRVGGAGEEPITSTDMPGLWLDKVCVYKAMIPHEQQPPHPL
ncbi:MAG: hypothetical protein ABW277_04615 [Longimicrobiaceae bacterium]